MLLPTGVSTIPTLSTTQFVYNQVLRMKPSRKIQPVRFPIKGEDLVKFLQFRNGI